ncbi:MAG: YfcE family phosphodiesterase [Treponema sp.]|nr:YfcE family phosphodiesterase [Treponema sp.]
MISITQNQQGIIGSEDALNFLKNKEHARVIAVSDSHGAFPTLSQIIKRFGSDCDALIFCGDGASDLQNLFALMESDKELCEKFPPVLAIVRGNCDVDTFSVKGLKMSIPLRQVLCVNGQSILITHGHTDGIVYNYNGVIDEATAYGAKSIVHGHTHVACQNYIDGVTVINPGSCSKPRGGQYPCFAILTVEKNFVDANFLKIEHSSANEVDFSTYRL